MQYFHDYNLKSAFNNMTSLILRVLIDVVLIFDDDCSSGFGSHFNLLTRPVWGISVI